MNLLEPLSRNKALFDVYAMEPGLLRKTARGDNRKPADPVVSRALRDWGLRPDYPDHKTFAVCLTHDVDNVYPPLSHTVLSSAHHIGALRPRKLRDELFWGVKGSPYRNFKQIMDLEEKYGGVSSFYFLTAESDVRRYRYDIGDLASDLGDIYDRGWEVGLHGGYYAYNDPATIRAEKKKLEAVLGKTVTGYRNHYLRFEVPRTWEYLIQCGFKYDTTVGYSDAIGFRNGMCHLFRPVDPVSKKALDIYELPMNVMDSAAFSSAGSFTKAWEQVRALIDTVEGLNGIATILWHNCSLGCAFRADWAKLYEKILSYCQGKDAWIASGDQIYRWARDTGYGSCFDNFDGI